MRLFALLCLCACGSEVPVRIPPAVPDAGPSGPALTLTVTDRTSVGATATVGFPDGPDGVCRLQVSYDLGPYRPASFPAFPCVAGRLHTLRAYGLAPSKTVGLRAAYTSGALEAYSNEVVGSPPDPEIALDVWPGSRAGEIGVVWSAPKTYVRVYTNCFAHDAETGNTDQRSFPETETSSSTFTAAGFLPGAEVRCQTTGSDLPRDETGSVFDGSPEVLITAP